MSKELFFRILNFCIKDNRYFKYKDKIYIQKKGLPMGSPASPIVADIVMEKLLDTCIERMLVKPKIITKYVDDLFSIVSTDQIESVMKELNNFHPSIKFTMEKESDSKLPYLDLLIMREGNSVKINWYQKPMASGRIINYFSKHPRNMIINTANNLIKKILDISDDEFHNDNKVRIRKILRSNDFPKHLIGRLIKSYKKSETSGTNEREHSSMFKSMIYIPDISERFKNAKLFDATNFKIAQRTHHTIGKLYSKTKDKIEEFEKSNVVYKISCNGNDTTKCEMVYVGTTKNKLKTRISGHKSDQRLLNSDTQKTALAAHCAKTRHSPNFNGAKALLSESNYRRRYMLEMLHIIKIPINKRINFKADTENCAQIYRHLVNKKTI